MSATYSIRRHGADGRDRGSGEQRKSIMVRAALTEWTPEQEEDSGTVSNGHLTHFGCDLTQGLDSLESPSVACIPLACGC